MTGKLTDNQVRKLEPPASGNRVVYDGDGRDAVRGFGIRVTASGARSFVLNYRFQGRERRITIGPYGPDQWTVAGARRRAGELRRQIENGIDPLGEKIDARKAPTVADMCQRFIEEHLPKLRPATATEYRALIETRILPALKHHKVAAVTFSDIDGLHRKLSRAAPYRANRVAALLSKMFALAVRWQWRTDNPSAGIEKSSGTATCPPRNLGGLLRPLRTTRTSRQRTPFACSC
jgi:hypothetical protein